MAAGRKLISFVNLNGKASFTGLRQGRGLSNRRQDGFQNWGVEPKTTSGRVIRQRPIIKGKFQMSIELLLAIACGVLAIIYGVVTAKSVISAPAGTARMQEIAAAIQEGAQAYLNRQYRAIAMVGVVVFVILVLLLNLIVGIGFLIGAILSGAAGYIGMYVSVRANVRTAEAARKGLGEGLSLAFRSGAVTGIWY